MKKGLIKKIFEYLVLPVIAFCSALNYAIFVFPNSFAPAGVDGICTMIQDLTNISIGYFSLLVNIPLLIIGFFILKKEYVIKTALYVVSFSIFNIILRQIDLSEYIYYTETSTSTVLAPIAAGAIRGILYAFTLKVDACSGGTDIVAAIVKHYKPYLNLMNVIFVINMVIALFSYPVYGFKADPVICSIIYSFITSTISNNIRANSTKMVKYEIITSNASALCKSIFDKIHRTATIMDAHGAFSGSDKQMIVCVIENQKTYDIEQLLNKQENTVFFKSAVNDLIN